MGEEFGGSNCFISAQNTDDILEYRGFKIFHFEDGGTQQRNLNKNFAELRLYC
jgi:hypothetical protein